MATASSPSPTTTPSTKLTSWDLFRSVGSPRHIMAPMVDASELAWRLLSRTPLPSGESKVPQLCYSPMINAKIFTESFDGASPHTKGAFDLEAEEEGSLDPIGEWGVTDRPLFVQFCANDPDHLLNAARRVQHRCDAIDLNLGCPQGIAKRGHYGAFLMEDWDLVYKLINNLHKNLDIPVTAKFRVYDDVEKTVAYAKMLESAGAQILTCHGRTRDMKGQLTGLADWEKIKAVKQAVKVPVFANGNILYYEDIQRCLDATGCDGVMSAEGNLYNPALFSPDAHPPITLLATRYLSIVSSLRTSTTPSAIKSHLFKILHPALSLPIFHDLRNRFGSHLGDPEGYRSLVKELEERITDKEGGDEWLRIKGEEGVEGGRFRVDEKTGLKEIPYYLAQPHTRPLDTSGAQDPHAATSTDEVRNATGASGTGTKSTILCIATECTNQASSSCPNNSCLRHCRLKNARKAGLAPDPALSLPAGTSPLASATLPSASLLPPTDEEAAINIGTGEDAEGEKEEAYEGMGCEFHEEKVKAKRELIKARREAARVGKLEKQKRKREGKEKAREAKEKGQGDKKARTGEVDGANKMEGVEEVLPGKEGSS